MLNGESLSVEELQDEILRAIVPNPRAQTPGRRPSKLYASRIIPRQMEKAPEITQKICWETG